MPWHAHSDSSIQPAVAAPQPVAKQKQSDSKSASSSAASGIARVGKLVKNLGIGE